ncbi:MAG: DNA-protecting protein DprA [Clostridia bacterium]|nr:DNA-protecting protein DprA [Clostridia bacterium]
MLSTAEQIKKYVVEIPRGVREYPKEWENLPDSPEILYAIGDVSLLRRRKFVIIGSRRTPSAAIKLGETIARELTSSFAIVTGTADGGDTAAIEGALNGGVICLLAGGFSAVPQGNLPLLERVAKKGLLLSVHPFDASVRTFSYEYRNKLLAAIGEGVLVLGAGEKSGSLITAKYAEKFEKPIFALPYPPNTATGAGCNDLLKKGGRLTENAEDILSFYGLNGASCREKPSLSSDEEKIYQALQEETESHISELSLKTGIPVFKLRAVLSALEVKGLTVSLGGNRYSVV